MMLAFQPLRRREPDFDDGAGPVVGPLESVVGIFDTIRVVFDESVPESVVERKAEEYGWEVVDQHILEVRIEGGLFRCGDEGFADFEVMPWEEWHDEPHQ